MIGCMNIGKKTTIFLFYQKYNLFEGQMVRQQKPGIKKHDFLYLSSLVILSSGLVTLLLFGLYCWYDTGKFTLLYGIPATIASEESASFWIGSIYVPIFVAFAGIAIAHRLINNTGNTRLSPALNNDMVIRMAAEADASTLENIMDILSGPDAAGIKYWRMSDTGAAQAGWNADHQPHGPSSHYGADHQPRQPAGHYGMPFATENDNSLGFGSSLTPGMTDNVPVQDADVGQMEHAAPVPIEHEVDPLPCPVNDLRDMTDTPANDPGIGSISSITPAVDEKIKAENKESTNEIDFIEQLRDPVNREKLAALLAGIEI
jgi:hypothetical protein